MRSFNLTIPTRIHFGCGVLSSAIEEERSAFPASVMLVTGKRMMRDLGYTDKVKGLLKDRAGVKDIVLFEEISPNPKTSEINTGISLGMREGVGMIIGLGGGSSIDAAKAIAVGTAGAGPIEPYLFEGQSLPASTLPITAIPTTAGTGSELSRGAILTSVEKTIKTGLRGDYLYPRIAIVDPELTFRVPPNVSMETGFDVFTHAVETFIAKQANVFSETLSLKAIETVVRCLPSVLADGRDIEARSSMSYASMMMGVNLANIGTCLPHRLQYPIGAMTDTGHARGLASLYQAWFHLAYEFSTEKFDEIGFILSGCATHGANEVGNSLKKFMKSIGIEANLSELGVHIDDIPALCTLVTGNLANDPVSGAPHIVRRIFESSLRT